MFAGSALGQEAGTVDDIREVKDLVEIPQPPNFGLWIAIAMGALIAGFLLWKLLTRGKQSQALSPAEIALADIESSRPLIGEESPEPLANAVTGAVRRYLDARFGIAAPRQTTEEFLRDLHVRQHPQLVSYGEDLGRFLRFCDAVRFGRGEVAAENRTRLIESARQFVESSNQPPSVTA